MSRVLAVTVVWTLLTSTSALEATEPPVATLKVFLYDYAALESGVTRRSVETAAQALLHAGLPSEWEHCGAPDSPTEGGCQGRAGAMVIQMRLQDREHGKKLGRRMYEFGYAVTPKSGLGVIAGVYVDRARTLADEQGYGLAVILGHAMAHEIGHLLLGVQSHSRSGLMTRVWKERELRLASTGLLRFTPGQSRRILHQISVRSRRTDSSRVLADAGHTLVGTNPNSLAGNFPLSPIPFRQRYRPGVTPTTLRRP